MSNTVSSPVGNRPERPVELTLGRVCGILWDCAWEALVLAFLIQILGGVVIGMVEGLWREMTPSLPPGFTGNTQHAVGHVSLPGSAWLHHYQFPLLFAVCFVGKAAGRLSVYSRRQAQPEAGSRRQQILHHLSEEWFSLVVVNAFTAFVAVIVIQFLQRFSLAQLLVQFLFNLLRPVLHTLGGALPGSGQFNRLGAWVNWYQANEFKFLFWLLYSAAVCDDLGLPNYKSLGRWLWRRWSKRPELPEESQAERQNHGGQNHTN